MEQNLWRVFLLVTVKLDNKTVSGQSTNEQAGGALNKIKERLHCRRLQCALGYLLPPKHTMRILILASARTRRQPDSQVVWSLDAC